MSLQFQANPLWSSHETGKSFDGAAGQFLEHSELNWRQLEQKAGFTDLMRANCWMEIEQYEQAADHCRLALERLPPRPIRWEQPESGKFMPGFCSGRDVSMRLWLRMQ